MTSLTGRRDPAWAFRPLPIGLIGVCAYVGALAVPWRHDVPLLLLAACGVAATLTHREALPHVRSSVIASVVIFLAATAVSTWLSDNWARSVRLSAPFVPAMLLCALIAGSVRGPRDLRLVYGAFSALALGMSAALFWTIAERGWLIPHDAAPAIGSPLLVAPNDVTFLTVIAPFSLMLLVGVSSRVVRSLSGLSLVTGLIAAAILQSRTALLTTIVALFCAAILMRRGRRLAIAGVLGIAIVVLATDAVLGFPVIQKSIVQWRGSGRLELWSAGWPMFRAAPWLGHGPNTFVLLHEAHLRALGPGGPDLMPWAHNLYLELLVERGIVGLAGYALIVGSAARELWRVRRHRSADTATLASGALAALIAFSVAGCLELTFLRVWVVVFFFVLVGVVVSLSRIEGERYAHRPSF